MRNKTSQTILFAQMAALLILSTEPAWPQATWTELFPTGGPSGAILGRQPVSPGYDPANNRLVVYFASNPAVSNPSPEVWVLTSANGLGGPPAWIQLSPSGSPPIANANQTSVYDPVSNRLTVYGGCYANCSPALSDVFVLTNANGLGGTPAWVPIAVTNPQPRDGGSAVYDASNNLMITFGGGLAFFGTDQNDTRTLSNANGIASPSSWSALSTSGGPPPVREAHTATYDQANNRMTIFGGSNLPVAIYNDAWVLANANGSGGLPAWQSLTTSGGPPAPRFVHSAVYDSTNNRMIVFGGLALSGSNYFALGDLWQLSYANGIGGTPTWTQLSPSGTGPGPNYSHVAVLDVANNRMIVFGGADQNSQVHKRVWVLTMGLGPLYSTCLLYDPAKAAKSGSTMPIKLQLCDTNGNNQSSPSITVHAVSITQTSTSISGPVQDSGNANPDNDFRFDSTLGTTGGYIFNLSTKGLATGTYNLNFTVTGDTSVYSAPFQVK
ncbi:MAG: hypothetical protein HYR60_05575 [Acidobacteria bacterium]|nr:hypothetical protein [Acidobacteriota bacterium]